MLTFQFLFLEVREIVASSVQFWIQISRSLCDDWRSWFSVQETRISKTCNAKLPTEISEPLLPSFLYLFLFGWSKEHHAYGRLDA